MKKIIFILILFSHCCLAQDNGVTIVYNKNKNDTSRTFEFDSYKTGMIISSVTGVIGAGILYSSLTNVTVENAESKQKLAKTGYLFIGASFAGILITNLAALPTKRISLSASENGIGLRYRL